MKSSHLVLFRHAVALCTLAAIALAQPAEKSAPPPPSAPPAPTDQPATPPPAPENTAPTPPEKSERAGESERPLRRIDQAAEEPSQTTRTGRRTTVRHSASGDFPFGDHYVPPGRAVYDAVSIFGSTTVDGEVRNDSVSVVGSTTIGPGAKVGGGAVAVLGRLISNGDIGRDAVNVLGGMEINGRVGGETVSVLGDVKLGPKAEIHGDLVVVGGRLTADPEAVVHGNRVNVPVLGFSQDLEWLTTWIRRCLLLGRPLAFGEGLAWAWGVAFAFLAFYALLALLFGRGVNKCVETLETRPGSSILASVLTVLLSPVAIILLAVTVVGVVAIPFFGAGLFIAKLFGKAVMLAWIGRRFTKLFGDGPQNHPFFAVVIGGLIVMLIYTIWGSFLVYKLLTWLGLGVVVYTIALSMKREKPAKAAAGGGPSGGSIPPSPGSPLPPVIPVAPVAAMTTSVPPPMPSPMSSGLVGGSSTQPDTPAAGATSNYTAEPSPSTVGAMPDVPMPPVPPAPPTPAMDAAPGANVASGAPPYSATPPTPPPTVPPITLRPAATTFISAATLPRAPLGIRLAAMALDVMLIGFVLGFMTGLVPRIFRFDPFPQGFLFMIAIYAAVMWKHRGTTVGGVICGLKVVRVDDRPLDWTTAIVRALSCFLSLIPAGLGFIWVAFDDEKQSWHDKIAGTTVVRMPKGVSLL